MKSKQDIIPAPVAGLLPAFSQEKTLAWHWQAGRTTITAKTTAVCTSRIVVQRRTWQCSRWGPAVWEMPASILSHSRYSHHARKGKRWLGRAGFGAQGWVWRPRLVWERMNASWWWGACFLPFQDWVDLPSLLGNFSLCGSASILSWAPLKRQNPGFQRERRKKLAQHSPAPAQVVYPGVRPSVKLSAWLPISLCCSLQFATFLHSLCSRGSRLPLILLIPASLVSPLPLPLPRGTHFRKFSGMTLSHVMLHLQANFSA